MPNTVAISLSTIMIPGIGVPVYIHLVLNQTVVQILGSLTEVVIQGHGVKAEHGQRHGNVHRCNFVSPLFYTTDPLQKGAQAVALFAFSLASFAPASPPANPVQCWAQHNVSKYTDYPIDCSTCHQDMKYQVTFPTSTKSSISWFSFRNAVMFCSAVLSNKSSYFLYTFKYLPWLKRVKSDKQIHVTKSD